MLKFAHGAQVSTTSGGGNTDDGNGGGICGYSDGDGSYDGNGGGICGYSDGDGSGDSSGCNGGHLVLACADTTDLRAVVINVTARMQR